MREPVTDWRRFASVEPLVFILFFTFSMSDNVTKDLIVYKTCLITLGLNRSECEILHSDNCSKEAMRIENLVQPHTSPIFMLQSVVQTIFPTVLSLFLGPWSDKYGRKPLMILSSAGQALRYTTAIVLSRFNVNPYWYTLPPAIAGLFGGSPSIIMACTCYLTDKTNTENRSTRLAMMDTSLFIGLLAGLLLGPAVLKRYGYRAVFLSSSIGCFLAMLYALIILKETVKDTNGRSFRSIFDTSLVKEIFDTVTRSKRGFDRFLVWNCIALIVLYVVALDGNLSIEYLFASAKLGWNISDFSFYQGTYLVITTIGLFLLVKVIGSIFKFSDTTIVFIACLSSVFRCFTKAFVQKPWHLYCSAFVGLFAASTIPVVRSIMSKSIYQNDLGKVFSLTATLELIVPFASTPIYLYTYTHTLKLYPSPVWFLSVGISLFMITLVVIVSRRLKRLQDNQYVQF